MGYLEEQIKDLEQYMPALTRREDFAKFWEESRRQWESVPLDVVMRLTDYPTSYVRVYEISYQGFDETRIHGWYLVPAFGENKQLPCLIHYHGFTESRGYPYQFFPWVMLGMAVISIDCRDQGGITGNCAHYTQAGQVGNVLTKGLLDKNEYYFRAVYGDSIKALDFACSRPEIDSSNIMVRGTSQGGAIGMAVCALDERPSLGIVNVPGNSNIEYRVIHRNGSFSSVNDYLRKYPYELERVFETLSYFDTMNMADSITCPIYASVALGDMVCPAKCYYASYNRIRASKQITVYPFNEHDGAGLLRMEEELRYVEQVLSWEI